MTGKYRPYPEYKDSGVEWFDAIPSHWTVMPLKWQIDRNDGGVWGNEPDGIDDTIVLRSTEQTVDGKWKLDDPAPRKLSASEKAFALLKSGDLLVTKSSGSSLHIGKTTLVSVEIENMFCCYSNFMQRLRTKPSLIPKLAWYVMNNELARSQFDFLSNSTTGLANLNGTMMGEVLLAVPKLEEQCMIVAFLDHQTAKIDALIEKQQQLIQLLKEKRQAVISHAVTKGLNPDAKMRDSDVEWLGKVPEGWIVKRLKHISPKIGVGLVINPSTYTRDEGVYFIFGGDVKEYGFDLSNTRRISPKDSDNLLPSRLSPRDLVCVRVGYPGITAVVTDELEGANCASVIVIRRGNYNSDWLCAAMNMWVGRQQVELTSYGAAQKQFNVADAIEFIFPVPPMKEQDEIAKFVAKTLARFSDLSEKSEKQISLLQERRTALISAAVTGKIDVRYWIASKNNQTNKEVAA
jgi:type I restriction enzyme S subunit